MELTRDITFLIVDDYDSSLKVIEANLKELGFSGEILIERDGAPAFDIIMERKDTERPVNFVICDLIMPGIDGLELLKRVRAIKDLKELPFLMLTSENEMTKVVEVLKADTSNYLLKPWTKDGLMEKIRFCWDKHHKKV